MDEIEYYRDIEGDIIYAAAGAWGTDGLFRLSTGPPLEWKFLVPESPEWDAVHQALFRNARARRLAQDSLPAGTPPVPKPPQGPFPEWHDHFTSENGFAADRYRAIAGYFETHGIAEMTVYGVLIEDQYETSFGDGEFHYFAAAYLTQAEADTYVNQHAREWTRYHIRPIQIRIVNREIIVDPSSWQRYDRHTAQEVAASLDARLTG